jgi:hypothetical protein
MTRSTGKRPRIDSNSRLRGSTTCPRPWTRTILGGPSKAHHINTMRAFSTRWAIVSTPLPTKSR